MAVESPPGHTFAALYLVSMSTIQAPLSEHSRIWLNLSMEA